MRYILPLLIALAGLALAAPASAQGFGQAAAVLTITPPQHDLQRAEPLVVEGTIHFTGDLVHALNLHGIPVEYKVTYAPPWASVLVTPGNDVIPLHAGPSPTVQGTRPLTVSILLSDAIHPGQIGVIEVVATLRPQQPGASAFSVSASIPVRVEGHPDDCPEYAGTTDSSVAPATVDPLAQQAAAPVSANEQPLYVQTGGATPMNTAWYAIGGFGLVGAGVGFVLWRRRSG